MENGPILAVTGPFLVDDGALSVIVEPLLEDGGPSPERGAAGDESSDAF